MSKVIDAMLDAALAYLNNVNAIHLCSQEPATRTEAVTTYSLGNKATPTINAAQDGAVDGRRRRIAAFSDGTQTGAGNATHWALVSATELIATGSLASSVPFGGSGTFSFTETDAACLRDAVSQ